MVDADLTVMALIVQPSSHLFAYINLGVSTRPVTPAGELSLIYDVSAWLRG